MTWLGLKESWTYEIFAPFLIALLLMLPSAALAQSACLSHDKLVDLLNFRYSEQRVAVGMESSKRLIEVFAARDGATWTMVMTSPDGASCVVAAGVDWLEQPIAKESN